MLARLLMIPILVSCNGDKEKQPQSIDTYGNKNLDIEILYNYTLKDKDNDGNVDQIRYTIPGSDTHDYISYVDTNVHNLEGYPFAEPMDSTLIVESTKAKKAGQRLKGALVNSEYEIRQKKLAEREAEKRARRQ